VNRSNDVISLTNVSNGLIQNCTIKNGYRGIKLSSCTNITIDDNTITNNSELGIGHFYSEYNNITNNNISLNGCNDSVTVGIGASIQGVSGVQQTGGQGIYMNPSRFVIISGNSIYHNKHDGIHVVNSHNITINDNCIYNNGPDKCLVSPTIQGPISYKIQQTGGQGIYMNPSHNITVYQNVIFNNSEYGVYILDGVNNTITYNDFIENNGVSSQAYDDESDPIHANIFSDNYWSDHSGSGNYTIDGGAGNSDSSPRTGTNTLTKTCPITITIPSEASPGFSFNVFILALFTIMLVVKKNPRFRKKE
jgi:parallel beta-helix repeat protein